MEVITKKSQISVFEGTSRSTNSSSYSSDMYNSSDDSDDDDDDDDYSDSDDSDDGYEYNILPDDNAIVNVLKTQEYCFDFTHFSEKLIDATFLEATKYLTQSKNYFASNEVIQPIIHEMLSYLNYEHSDSEYSHSFIFPQNPKPKAKNWKNEDYIEWPKISEFNIKLGLEKLEDYVATWKRPSDWLFCVEFLGFESEDCSNIFVYEVEWSKPSNAYPIPQASASVFFALEVFKMVPHNHDRRIQKNVIMFRLQTRFVLTQLHFY
ncbi:conserved hypothetical protein [Pediculus humanus corporis]|uniref:Uncharacterized protein n=1 Tax=Pediculus humanus subsp. corporis TaxID=121224 RepID=E0VGB4_PEDHC|nr:uncharacterized protein Phum_PHUM177430 [Pediculus humanus corporis]EEB12420.1 conserved hypothetical protein [Pediculus humanus corporis]